jgi:hypothetical protein
MPRPSPNERRKIEARKRANAKSRAEQADKDALIRKRVEGLLNDALGRSRARDPAMLPDKAEIVAQLAEARMMALSCWPPQTQAAINASMATAKLLGFVVDRAAVAVGGPEDFRRNRAMEDVLNDLRDSVGDGPTERFLSFIESERRFQQGDDDAIEGEARRLGNDSADGAGHD